MCHTATTLCVQFFFYKDDSISHCNIIPAPKAVSSQIVNDPLAECASLHVAALSASLMPPYQAFAQLASKHGSPSAPSTPPRQSAPDPSGSLIARGAPTGPPLEEKLPPPDDGNGAVTAPLGHEAGLEMGSLMTSHVSVSYISPSSLCSYDNGRRRFVSLGAISRSHCLELKFCRVFGGCQIELCAGQGSAPGTLKSIRA